MRRKLLLAEDSVTMQKVFELALEQTGISVIAVDNGHDAIRLVEEIGPDLVVADVTLPGVDGFGVASAIRETWAGKNIPILILSGTMVPLDEERFKACGAQGVLYKPFECRELLEKVESLVRETPDVPEAAHSPEPPPKDEQWDFADVLDEAEGVVPEARAEEPGRTGEAVFPGFPLPAAPKDEPLALNEFDVSMEEIEEAPSVPPVPEIPPAETEEVPFRAAHIEGSVEEDAPRAVTNLLPEEEAVEEIEEIQDIQEFEELSAAAEPAAEPALSENPPPQTPADPAPADEAAALQAAMKEQFSARAEAIFRAVATEAVEKAMWEMMDRLSAEFSEKIRESVEAVAWEVIPATAEALIRDEIARIRSQAGKPSP